MGITIWDAAARPRRRCPGSGTAAVQGARALHGRRWRALRERAPSSGSRSATCSRPCSHESGYLDALEAERTIEAQGRIENLEELVEVAREFDAARRGRRRHASTPSSSRSRCVADADTRARRRGPRDAHDAPQRQGPGVPDRLHHRLRGGRLPALALARRGHARGGAAALLRRHHAGDARPLPAPTRGGATSSARASYGLPPRSWPRSRRTSSSARAAGVGRLARGAGARRRPPAPDGLVGERAGAGAGAVRGDASALGDDVVHAAFGEGVVTGVEPGGIVVVRFAADGSRAQAHGRVRPDHASGSVRRR